MTFELQFILFSRSLSESITALPMLSCPFARNSFTLKSRKKFRELFLEKDESFLSLKEAD